MVTLYTTVLTVHVSVTNGQMDRQEARLLLW